MSGLGPVSLDLGSRKEMPEFLMPYNSKCEICNESLLNPMQTQCGHRLCRECLEKHFVKHGDPAFCPYNDDDCVALSRKDNSVFPDFVLIKELKEKEVFCGYKHNGCQEIIKWGSYKKHMKMCQFGKVSCPYAIYGCSTRPPAEMLQKHKQECDFSPKKCSQCEMLFGKTFMKSHIDEECEFSIISCPYGCEIGPFLRKDLNGHKGSCKANPKNCKFTRMGCSFVGSEKALAKHNKEETEIHLQLMTVHSEILERKITEMENIHKEEHSSQSIQIKLIVQKLNRQEHRMKETEKVILDQEELLSELQVNMASKDQLPNSPAMSTKGQQELKQKTEETTKHVQELSKSVTECKVEQKTQEKKIKEITGKMSTFDLRFQVLETASYDGGLLWKIRDYNRRKTEAKNGGILSLYSQPFYTSRHGYRMCARVYLNGDGMGENTHVSLFFVIMKGEYDALLKWPFRQRVSLMLLDQENGTRNIVDSFRPDPSSSSFQRPKSDMNIASGCPLFVSHTILEAKDAPYIRDDTIFIKIVADVTDLQHP